MADDALEGMNIAILVTDGFEQVELTRPRKALDEAGATTQVVSPKADRVRGWNFTDWGDELPVDVPLDEAEPEDFDALLLPGGAINPDSLRIEPKAIAFVKAFFRCREAGSSDLPRSLDHHQCRRSAWAADDIMALARNGPWQCRRQMGG